MVDKLREIASLEADINEKENFIRDARRTLAVLHTEQQHICAKKLKTVLNNRRRYNLEGLRDALQEICPHTHIEHQTYRAYYDRDEVYTLKCHNCSMHIMLD